MALLEIRELVRRFDTFTAVDSVHLSIEAGEFFTLLGPSGCGKTTLLRLLAGFDSPDSGDILLDGQSQLAVPPEKRPIHTVFQNYALFPHMTVSDNIAFPLKMAGVAASERSKRVQEQLEAVHLGAMARRFPHELSGGQRQRVAIARALINRPRLLLLDEPLAALDLKLREQMQMELIRLQRELGITFVYVTHDQGEALALSHRIAVMNKGRVEQLDEPAILYSQPKNRFVADFIGQCNLLEAEVDEIAATRMRVNLKGVGATLVPTVSWVERGDSGVVALRPEKIKLAASLPQTHADEVHFKGVVHDCLYLGDVTLYVVELHQGQEGARIEAMLANSGSHRAQLFEVGDAVEVAWHFDAALFLKD